MTKLRTGTTTADLKFSSEQSAVAVQNLIRDGTKKRDNNTLVDSGTA